MIDPNAYANGFETTRRTPASPAVQPVGEIKPWQDRVRLCFGPEDGREVTESEAKDAEIAELRAALSPATVQAAPVDAPDTFTQNVYALLEHVATSLFSGLDYNPSQRGARAKISAIMRQAMSDRMGKELLADLYAAAPALPAAAGADAKDAARLDFMIEHEAWISWSRDRESCRVFVDDLDSRRPFIGWVPEAYAKDPREAIDAAIASSAEEVKP